MTVRADRPAARGQTGIRARNGGGPACAVQGSARCGSLQEAGLPADLYSQAAASVDGVGSRGNPLGGAAEWSGAMVGLDYRDIADERFVNGSSRAMPASGWTFRAWTSTSR